MSPRIGSLFTGYAGLDCAVQEVLGGQVAWYSENNPAASKVLAHHHPDVPNLGDITTINWGQVAPVDILTGGFPCQDVSSAGRRAGMGEGTRSGLWAHMATAVDRLHPQLVVIENVRGLTSARADCDLEPCPWCLGDDEHVHLRALDKRLTRERDEAREHLNKVRQGLRTPEGWATKMHALYVRQQRDKARDLLGVIWLHVGWRSVTRHLTTEQRELWADAVEVAGAPGSTIAADRWWRDDAGDPGSPA